MVICQHRRRQPKVRLGEGLGLRCAPWRIRKAETACHYAALLGRHDVLQAGREAWRAQASEEHDRKRPDLRGQTRGSLERTAAWRKCRT